jgi:hypothetical protein
MVDEKEMPLPSYTWMHARAKLSDEQRTLLVAFFKTLRTGAAVTESDELQENPDHSAN